jgi:elongation factor Ts
MNTELLSHLRALTGAGMKDCKEALEEANWDLQAALDIVKTKGLNITDGRSGRVAADGLIALTNSSNVAAGMVEVNCQTDFVANSPDFKAFVRKALNAMCEAWNHNREFNVNDVEEARKELVAITKENIVVRRWWSEESLNPMVRVFSYLHSNQKIGVILTLKAPTVEATKDDRFLVLGDDLCMQIAAMNPLAVSPERLPSTDIERQKIIFETQLKELNKPAASWGKIMEGKMRKWNTEVCLSDQESVMVPKMVIKQVIKSVGDLLGGEIEVVNFIRCQVGEGIEVKKESSVDFANEVAKLSGVHVHTAQGLPGSCPDCPKDL